MPQIDKYFKGKKSNSIETAFLRQCEEKENIPRQNECTDETNILKNKIEILEIENQDIKKKYENLKSKHISLLQVLLKLEEKNQDLEMKIKSEAKPNETHLFEDDKSSRLEQSSDFSTHLVNVHFSLNIFDSISLVLIFSLISYLCLE